MTSSSLPLSSPPPPSRSEKINFYLCYVILVVNQMMYTGLYIISKAAFNRGMSTIVFIVYRQAAGSILLLPFAIAFRRKTFMKLTFSELWKVFSLALFGITLNIEFSYASLKYTSATLASALTNSVPVLTFCFALLFRTEKIKLKSSSGIAKATGIAVSIAGIFVIALYGGPLIKPLSHHHVLGQSSISTTHSNAWLKGSLLMTLSCICWSLWLVVQSIYLTEFPSKLLLTTLQCTFSALQSLCAALVLERDFAKWKLGFDVGLIAVVYSGFVQALTFYLQTWCIEKKGAVFYALSFPLALVFTIIAETFFLGEAVHLGSILGGIFLTVGLYSVMWGKNKDYVKSQLPAENLQESRDASFG
ncbi:WAT1-related protein At5g64700-like [Typha angustifolia]|uniref:WAT1-related protein At5g64700-like n=1 Tax=Typha angustifolia TaxID=59011 RepID=UPI003C2C0D74